jgi:S1-C subfamily serine protease
MATSLDEISEAVRRAAEGAGPSVVGIGRAGPRGSGVVLADGRILTNAHNVRGDEPTITFHDGRKAAGTVAGVDADGDLAVVTVDTAGAPAVAWSESPASLGTPVVALANPGGRGLRATFGLVSAVDRAFRGPRGSRVPGGFEHTAPLPRGSSGGPVLDVEGRLLGINTSRRGDGFYLAIPADAALRERVDALARGESRERPRLGIGVAPGFVARRLRRAVGLPERDGILVRVVEEGSPAAAAGIEAGDLIVGVGDRDAASVDDLHAAVEGAEGRLELRLVRGVEERAVSVSLSGGGPAPERA